MEPSLMNHFGRKVAIAAVAFATVGSTLFGGAALADDEENTVAPVWKGGGAQGGNTYCMYKDGFIDIDATHALSGLLGKGAVVDGCKGGPALGGDD
jgi:hypothetical protein